MSSLFTFVKATGVFLVAREANTSRAVSSIAPVANEKLTVTVPLVGTTTVLLPSSYPMTDAVNVYVPAGTLLMMYAPFRSAAAPISVPSTTTFAPARASPASFATVPWMAP